MDKMEAVKCLNCIVRLCLKILSSSWWSWRKVEANLAAVFSCRANIRRHEFETLIENYIKKLNNSLMKIKITGQIAASTLCDHWQWGE